MWIVGILSCSIFDKFHFNWSRSKDWSKKSKNPVAINWSLSLYLSQLVIMSFDSNYVSAMRRFSLLNARGMDRDKLEVKTQQRLGIQKGPTSTHNTQFSDWHWTNIYSTQLVSICIRLTTKTATLSRSKTINVNMTKQDFSSAIIIISNQQNL